jgi:hypothetical protein
MQAVKIKQQDTCTKLIKADIDKKIIKTKNFEFKPQ